MKRSAFASILALWLTSCASVIVTQDPLPTDRGVRYYRPKPYLLVGAAPGNEKASKGSSAGEVRVGIQLAYLPDYNEEYAIELRPGLGIAKLGIELEDGWNLKSVNMESDPQLDELITAGARLVGELPMPTREFQAEATADVPLGFYEAVIACDPAGRKQLLGWRYVGFLPFHTCPVLPQVGLEPVGCTADQLWALVQTPAGLRFKTVASLAGQIPSAKFEISNK